MDELRILKEAKVPGALETLDDDILAALSSRQREASAMQRMLALAAFVALGGGFVAGIAAVPPAAASPITPLIATSPLASAAMLGAR